MPTSSPKHVPADVRSLQNQGIDIASSLKEFREENMRVNSEILKGNQEIRERLDGKVGDKGMFEGGLCATVRNHGYRLDEHDVRLEHIDRGKQWMRGQSWAAVTFFLGAVVSGLSIAIFERWLLK